MTNSILPVFTLHVSHWSSVILTHCSMYNLLICLLSCQYQFALMIWINLVSFHGHMPSTGLWSRHTVPHLCPNYALILFFSIPITSVVPFLNPDWSSPGTSSIFLLILLLSTFTTIFAVCAMRLIMWWLLHFVALGFFKGNHCNFSEILGPLSSFIYVDQLYIECKSKSNTNNDWGNWNHPVIIQKIPK